MDGYRNSTEWDDVWTSNQMRTGVFAVTTNNSHREIVAMTTMAVDTYLWRGDRELWGEIIINVIVWVMWLVTIIGNALVIAVFVQNRQVRNKVSNLYILNLAMSDFIVGCIPLGMNNVYRLEGTWPFGEKGCKLWLVTDFSACFVSVWAIVFISYDRYILVTKGLEYDRYQTRGKFCILAGLSWVGCFLRYGIGFIGYDIWNDSSVDYTKTCDNPVLYIFPLIVSDWVLSICLPVALITFFNVVVYVNIFKRTRGLPINWATNVQSDNESKVTTVSERTTTNQPNPNAQPTRREGTTDIRKLRKSAITLALIVSVSSVCWSPYYAYIFATILFNVNVHIVKIMATYYIWWGNSACNPFLFVATNPGIRNGVFKILHIRKR